MELKNCVECGRSFASKQGESLCKRCMEKKVDDDFTIVREYLYSHPGADIKDVSEATGVDEKIIFKLLREERLEVVEEENSLLRCKKCGKSIRSGRLCEACKKLEFAKELKLAGEDLKRDMDKKIGYYSRD